MKKKVISVILSIVIILAGVLSIPIIKNTMTKSVMSEISGLGSMTALNTANSTDMSQFADAIQKKVAQINTPFALGTGFLYNDKGDFITNAHVVDGTVSVKVVLQDKTTYEGIVIGRDPKKDIALVRVNDLAGLKPLEMHTEEVKIMDEVIAFGSPLGYQNTVTFGRISGLNRDIIIEESIYSKVYQTDAAVSPGNSGGPLISKNSGKVIGINSCIDVRGENIAFSIPVTQILEIVSKWASNPQIEQEFDSMSKFVKLYIYEYYDYINNQKYLDAYEMLGEDLQKQSYTTFRNQYLNVYSVTIESMESIKNSSEQFEITANLGMILYGDNGRIKSQVKKIFTIGLENDQYKIINSKQIS